uniref:RNA-directed DNA polymerase homolog n=1 Tax=Nicotiana tabacum TaxID=4097 RepID=A0A1S4A2V3_TOBAC|nr:PREDICTED: RNA-directed DNA polymerase homolog [Nicotiana tabacum]
MAMVTGWRICIDYRKLNNYTRKNHFPLPFIDQMLDRLTGQDCYCFLDGYSGYNQISIAPEDQEKTTFTCPCGIYAFKRIPFGLCNAPATSQTCMMAIFTDMVEKFIEVFMDNISVFGPYFDECLTNLSKVLARFLEKDTPFMFDEHRLKAYQELKKRLEFDVEIKDRKGTQNLVADNFSCLATHAHVEEGGKFRKAFLMSNC